MTFVTTGLLVAGAVSMLVPILIHLFARQRRRPVEWAAMQFLLEALRKRRRRIQLEQMLLLAARCLIVLVLGAALARPFLSAAGVLEGLGSRTVFLVVDNGIASGARSGDAGRTALAASVEQARAIVAALGPGDSVGLITAARPAAALVVPPSSDLGAVADLLAGLEPAESPTDLGSALLLLRDALGELGPERRHAVAYLLSEFRAGSAPLDSALPQVLPGGPGGLRLLASPAAQEPAPDVQVTGLDSLRGLVLAAGEGAAEQVTVTLARSGGDLPRDVTRVRLGGEGVPPIEPRVVEWDEGQDVAAVDFTLNLAGRGDAGLAVRATIDEDALAADNARYTVLLSRDRVRVLLADRRRFGADPALDRLRAGQWIQKALQPSERSPIDVVEVDAAALGAVDVRGADAVIVARPDLLAAPGWDALHSFLATGGLVIVTPPGESNVHPWTDRLVDLGLPWRIALEAVEPPQALTLPDEQPASELLRVLSGELPELLRPVLVQKLLPADMQQTQAETVLVLSDGSPLLIAGNPRVPGAAEGASAAAGLVIYLAAPPEWGWTTLPAQPLMVPLFHELIRQGIGSIRASQRYVAGEQPFLGLGPAASALIDPRGSPISVRSDGAASGALARSGLYTVLDHGMQPMGTLAVNVDAAAARTDVQDQAAVSEWLARSAPWQLLDPRGAASALETTGSGASLAGVLLIALLSLVVVETALARWFSHGRPSGREAAAASPRAAVRGAAAPEAAA
jgi:hypothetical protein